MQLVFAVAGAVIAPPGFASIGWAIGSTIGGMLFPPGAGDVSQSGPRLGDPSVRISSYGQPAPLLYGTLRVPCVPFWSTGLIETETSTTQDSGGKGGGGSVTTTT